MAELDGTTIRVEEQERIYHFGQGNDVVLKDVFEVVIRPSGTHRVKTKDLKLHIIPLGWIHIEITSPKDWVA